MRIVPVYVWDKLPSADKRDGLVSRLEQPVLRKVIEQRGIRLRRLQDPNSYFVDRIALESRVLIVEGISGSGKDTFQAYLKEKLKGRVIYDYSEGDVLHSWKHLQIEGIFKLRVKFMKLFVNYIKDTISRDENAVFLLNRFHLSTCGQQPKLGSEYDEVINVLRMVPVHVFILQVDENEMERKSLHPERSAAWQKFQLQMEEKGSFRARLERQQRVILETAKRQQIPYSVIKLIYEPKIGDGRVRISKAPSIVRHSMRMNAADAKISQKKSSVPQTVEEDI
jgi:thymidylate kinase